MGSVTPSVPGSVLLTTEIRRCARRRLIQVLPVVTAVLVVATVVTSMVLGARYGGDEGPTTIGYVVRAVVPVAAVVGSLLQGAWFSSSTVTGLLVLEPRRVRVAAAQAAAAGLVTGVALGASLIGVGVGLVVWAAWSGQAVSGEVAVSCAATIAAATVACTFAAWFGAAIATITRSSAAAVSVVLIGFFVVEPMVTQLMAAATHRYGGGMLPLGSLVEVAVPIPETAGIRPWAPWPPILTALAWITTASVLAAWRQLRRDLT